MSARSPKSILANLQSKTYRTLFFWCLILRRPLDESQRSTDAQNIIYYKNNKKKVFPCLQKQNDPQIKYKRNHDAVLFHRKFVTQFGGVIVVIL